MPFHMVVDSSDITMPGRLWTTEWRLRQLSFVFDIAISLLAVLLTLQ